MSPPERDCHLKGFLFGEEVCSGVNNWRPILTWRAGWTWMLRSQLVAGPQAAQMTVSWVAGLYSRAIATAA